MDRPALGQLIRLATNRPRRVDVIVVEDLSRLSRSVADLFAIQRLLEYAGCGWLVWRTGSTVASMTLVSGRNRHASRTRMANAS